MLLPGTWYAVNVRIRYEHFAAEGLKARAYEVYVPCYIGDGCGGRRETPLFPGYVFCRFSDKPWLSIVSTPAVRKIVGYGNIPAAVDSGELEAVRRLAEADIPRRPYRDIPVGSLVEIQSGPLAGLRGTLLSQERKLVISVSLLRRSVAAELEGTVELKEIKPNRGAVSPS